MRETYEITRGYSFVIFSSVFNEVCLKCDILVPLRCRKKPKTSRTMRTVEKNQQNPSMKITVENFNEPPQNCLLYVERPYAAQNFGLGCNETD
jgi:hypothetical protein